MQKINNPKKKSFIKGNIYTLDIIPEQKYLDKYGKYPKNYKYDGYASGGCWFLEVNEENDVIIDENGYAIVLHLQPEQLDLYNFYLISN